MKSIRFFLVIGIAAILVLYNFIAAMRGYQSSMHEAEALFDNQLRDLSQLVASIDIPRSGNNFRFGNDLAFQIWENEHLLVASHYAPTERMNAFVPGFDFANFNGYRWRTHTRFDENSGRWIIVAERSDLRFLLAENVVLESIAPILLGIPLAGFLIWVTVSFGLKPLRQLSTELRQKRVQDLSPLQHQQIPRELDQIVQSINGLIQRLSGVLEREKRFSVDAAHELRTPISAVKIQLHNLEQEVNPHSESFRQLQQGVERMQHLAEQLLSLYRGSSDQFAASCTHLDLLVLIQAVIARHYPLIEERGQSIELEGTDTFVNGEHFALETLVTNLISNASRYTQKGGHILVRVERTGDKVCLVVEDDGPGIPVAERAHIFERFYRGGSANLTGVAGCGLGLAIVAHVAALHQATVAVEDSSLGRGTSFRVCFPEITDVA